MSLGNAIKQIGKDANSTSAIMESFKEKNNIANSVSDKGDTISAEDYKKLDPTLAA